MTIRRTCSSLLLTLVTALSGCSTGLYLKPEAPGGTYSTENPACPGAKEVIELRPASEKWIVFRVLAKHHNRAGTEGTNLIAYFRFMYMLPEPPRTSWSLFASDEEKEEKKSLLERRRSQKNVISAASPFATVVLPDGTRTQASLPFFEKPYDPNAVSRPYGIWGPEVQIATRRLEKFTVIFPEISLNGRKLDVPPVVFGVEEGKYVPVLNC